MYNGDMKRKQTNVTPHTIIATNSEGQQMKSGQWWAIIKPIRHPVTDQHDGNVVYHVGKEKYIRRIWNKKFKD